MLDQTFDPGAQNERTAMAWTRTTLALLVGVVLAARLAAEPLGIVAVVFGVVVASLALAMLVLARRRYRRAHDALHAEDALPDGKLPAMVTVIAVLLALLEITYTVID